MRTLQPTPGTYAAIDQAVTATLTETMGVGAQLVGCKQELAAMWLRANAPIEFGARLHYAWLIFRRVVLRVAFR